MLRRIVPASAAAALLLAGGLTGCSAAQQTAAETCTSAYPGGALSSATEVTGAFGTLPSISAPKDIDILNTQRSIAISGEDRSDVVTDGSLIGYQMSLFDSLTGQPVSATPGLQDPSQGLWYSIATSDANDPFTAAVLCAAPGDRIVVAYGPAESSALASNMNTQLFGAALIGVIDVESVAAPSVKGSVRGLPSGYPAVVTNEEGRPGMVLPPAVPAAGTTSAIRIQGEGPEVTAEQNVVAQVLTVGWDGNVVTNTWDGDLLALGSEAQPSQPDFAFRSQLTGKPVGSQVVIVQSIDGVAQAIVVDILAAI